MADVIHEHTIEKEGEGSGMGFFLGAVMLVVVLIFLFYFDLPYLSSASSSPQINVPGKIDVNVNQQPKQ